MICGKSLTVCQTPGMCSPFGGCKVEYSQSEREYDELYSDWQELKRKNKELISYYERYRWIRERHTSKVGCKTATVVFWLDEPYEPENAEELDRMIDNFLEVSKDNV